MTEKTTYVLDKASCHAADTASHVTTTHVLDKASCHAAYTASHVPSEIMTEKTTNVLDKASCHAAYTASHVPTTHVLDKASCHAAYTASHRAAGPWPRDPAPCPGPWAPGLGLGPGRRCSPPPLKGSGERKGSGEGAHLAGGPPLKPVLGLAPLPGFRRGLDRASPRSFAAGPTVLPGRPCRLGLGRASARSSAARSFPPGPCVVLWLWCVVLWLWCVVLWLWLRCIVVVVRCVLWIRCVVVRCVVFVHYIYVCATHITASI